jgi:hypothetical protein
VLGLTIGMALRVRTADGWWSLRVSCVVVNVGGDMYAEVAAEDNDNAGVTCCGCIWSWRGDESGEPLEREERSEEAEWMD